MIKINGVIIPYNRAVNFLNFDKRGNPNGMDSLGFVVSHADKEEHPLTIYVGLKFDVISIFTNRGISTFLNLSEEHKSFLQTGECYSSWDSSEEEVELYIDIHKIAINIRQLYSYVYGCEASKEAFCSLVEKKVFGTLQRKSARAISMHPTLQFEGSLEAIGFVYTEDEKIHLLNELLVEDRSIADEIFFSNWFVPRDIKFYNYDFRGNEVAFEEGSDYVDGLGGIVLTSEGAISSFSYDRRSFRAGYWDLSQPEPLINVGFRLQGSEHSGTFFVRDREEDDSELSMSPFSLKHIYASAGTDRLFQLLSKGYMIDSDTQSPLVARLNVFKYLIDGPFQKKRSQSWRDCLDNIEVGALVDSIAETVGNPNPITSIRVAAIEAFNRSYTSFLFAGNIIRNDKAIILHDLRDTVVFVYHPVLDKYFFYEVDGVADEGIQVDSDNNVSVVFDGFRYGHMTNGDIGEFYWSNIPKAYRAEEKEISFSGRTVSLPDREYIFSMHPVFADNMDNLGSKIKGFSDLEYEGKCAFVIALKKTDLSDIISKEFGVCDSSYILGTKSGYLEVD